MSEIEISIDADPRGSREDFAGADLTLPEWHAVAVGVYYQLAVTAGQLGYSVKPKSSSRCMRLLSRVYDLLPGAEKGRFMRSFTTVGLNTIWESEEERSPWSRAVTLAHEIVHIVDRRSDKLFNLRYALPQVLSPLALLALLAFWQPWFLLALGFLVFLYPFKRLSSYRYYAEVRGYRMSMFMQNLGYEIQGAQISESRRDRMVEHVSRTMSSASYLWMVDAEQAHTRMVREDARVQQGSVLAPLDAYSLVGRAVRSVQDGTGPQLLVQIMEEIQSKE